MDGPAAASARAAPRVHYLADFGCPLGDRALGGARVLSAGAQVLVSTGDRLVHVYDREGQRLSAVFEFPAPVSHLELLAGPAALLVLCARSGLYRVSLDPASRDSEDSTGGSDSGHSEDSWHAVDSKPPVPRTTVGPVACILPGPTLAAFVVWGDMLVTLSQGPARWKVQLTPLPAPGQGLVPPSLAGEVDLPVGSAPTGTPEQPQATPGPPVLCVVAPPGPGGLDAVLLGLLFGADACLLRSSVLLCGLPGGQLCGVLLQALVTSGWAAGDPQALVRTVHHLEEPVVLVGVLRTEPPAEGQEDAPSDCLVALGRGGRLLAIKAHREEAGSPGLELREYRVPGPVLCAAWDGAGRLLFSAPSGLRVLDLAQGGDPQHPRGLPPDLCPAGTSLCSLTALTVSPRTPGGDTSLLALSARGRLLACTLGLPEWPLLAGASAAGGAQHVRHLLSRIAAVSERVTALKTTAERQNRALQGLNAAAAVVCALLRGQEGPAAVSCRAQAAWTRLPSGDALLACCVLETGPGFSLGQGWALSVRLLPGAVDAEDAEDAVAAAHTCTVPLGPLGPGSRRTVTLPLGQGEGAPQLPVTLSCRLFYDLRGSVGGALAGALPAHEGLGLSLGRHVVDVLHALRVPGRPAPPAPCGPPRHPVDAFLQALCGRGAGTEGQYLPPAAATVTVSTRLLQTALAGQSSDLPPGPAALQWLLSGNLDAAKAPALPCLRGVAPDGTDVRLVVREVSVPDVSPAGPLQAVEIRVESPSLAVLCAVHHAIARRVQSMVTAQAPCSAPDLRTEHLHHVQASQQVLLRDLRTLREQLRLGEEEAPRAAAQRLLRAFQQLRGPGSLLL